MTREEEQELFTSVRNALEKCAAKFAEYAALHSQKITVANSGPFPPAGAIAEYTAKAKTNLEMVLVAQRGLEALAAIEIKGPTTTDFKACTACQGRGWWPGDGVRKDCQKCGGSGEEPKS